MTGSTHANNRSVHTPRPKPEGPATDNPIRGPRTGMTRSKPGPLASAGASGRHKGPGSRPASTCPAQPPSKAGGDSPWDGGRHHGDGKADRSTNSNRTGQGTAHQRGATRHAREAHHRPQPRHEERCQATTANGCREPVKRAQHTTNCGTGEGAKDNRAPTPAHRTDSQWKAGPGRTPEETRGQGWESARSRTPHIHARGAGPGRPRAAPTARKSARCGVGDGSPRPHPPHQQPVGKWAPAARRQDEWSGVGGRPTLDAPHPGKRRPPRAPSCHPHSTQSQLARARAVGLVMGPHACTPRTHSQWVVGPGRTSERTSGRGWESAQPRTPHTEARGVPPRHPHAAPTARKASTQDCALWGW